MVSAQIAYFRYRAYGPLVLAPAEGLGALWAPCQVGVIYLRINSKKIPVKSIDIWLIYNFVKIWS